MKEVFRTILQFPNYEVSNYGNVRSLSKCIKQYNPRWECFLLRHIKGKILKPWIDTDGYRYVNLSDNGIKIKKKISILVLENFISKRPNGYDSSHMDGNRKNDMVTNLIWESRKDNMYRKIEHGTYNAPPRFFGEKHPNSKLKKEDILAIRHLAKQGLSQRKIGKIFGVNHTTVGVINRREGWVHV